MGAEQQQEVKKKRLRRPEHCLLRNNEQLKTLIAHRMKERGLTVYGLSRQTEVDQKRIDNYLRYNYADMQRKRRREKRHYPYASQLDLMGICYFLGISLKIDFFDRERQELIDMKAIPSVSPWQEVPENFAK